jgi:hypothetical protein
MTVLLTFYESIKESVIKKMKKAIVLLCIVIGFITGNGFAADGSSMTSGTTNNLNGVYGSSGSVFTLHLGEKQ